MSGTSLEFYALPQEVRSWLRAQLHKDEAWCLLWEPQKHPEGYTSLTANGLDVVPFKARTESGCMIFLGNKTLAPTPVFKATPHSRQTLDFVRSRTIQLIPPLIVNENILLEGRLSIMRRADYRLQGISYEPLFVWFRSVAASLKHALADRSATLMQNTTLGTVKAWPRVIVSNDAVKWRQSGRLLKQFPCGEVQFDVKVRKSSG